MNKIIDESQTKQLYQKWRKKMKEYGPGYSIKISRNVDEKNFRNYTFIKNHIEVMLKIRNEKGIYDVNITSHYGLSGKTKLELVDIALLFLKEYANVKNIGILWSDSFFFNHQNYTKSGYDEFEDWEKYKPTFFNRYFEYKEKEVSKFFEISKKYKEYLEKKKREDVTFQYSYNDRFYTVRKKGQYETVNIHLVHIYHNGFRGEIEFETKENKYTFIMKELKWEKEIQFPDDVDEILDELFEMIDKKMRLENLYTPPKKHFSKLVEPVAINSKQVTKMFNILLERMKAKEIEEKSAIINEENKLQGLVKREKGIAEVILTEKLDYIFVINHKTDEVYGFQNENDAYEKYQETLKKQIERMGKESIKLFKANRTSK